LFIIKDHLEDLYVNKLIRNLKRYKHLLLQRLSSPYLFLMKVQKKEERERSGFLNIIN